MNTNPRPTKSSAPPKLHPGKPSAPPKPKTDTKGLNFLISTLGKMLADINGLLAIHDTPQQLERFGPYHDTVKKGLTTCIDGILDLLNTVRTEPACDNGEPANKHGWRADALWKQLKWMDDMIDAALVRNDDNVRHYERMMEDVVVQLRERLTQGE